MRGRDRGAYDEMVRQNLQNGAAIRKERTTLEAEVEQQQLHMHALVKARVEQARGGGDSGYATLDARLDAQEDAAAEALRQRHSHERRERHLAAHVGARAQHPAAARRVAKACERLRRRRSLCWIGMPLAV